MFACSHQQRHPIVDLLTPLTHQTEPNRQPDATVASAHIAARNALISSAHAMRLQMVVADVARQLRFGIWAWDCEAGVPAQVGFCWVGDPVWSDWRSPLLFHWTPSDRLQPTPTDSNRLEQDPPSPTDGRPKTLRISLGGIKGAKGELLGSVVHADTFVEVGCGF